VAPAASSAAAIGVAPTGAASERGAGYRGYNLREKLERVTLVRALLVTLLLTSAVVVNVNDLDSLTAPSYSAIWGLIIATYVATMLYAIFIRSARDLRPLAMAQFVGDSLLAGGLVLVTGGQDSLFVFLFFLSIVNAASLLGRDGALFSASCASLTFAVCVLTQSHYVPLVSELGHVEGASAGVSTYSVAVNIVAFYTVAVLAGHLAERLGQVDTELERRRLDIRELRALNENIVSSIAAGLCTLDSQDRIISFNRAAEEMTGVKADDLLGRRCATALPQLAIEVELYRAQPGRGPRQVETVIEAADGRRRDVEIWISALTDERGEASGLILSFNDITALRQLQENAARQRRMAAIGQLSAAIAHEIRNPLASISGSLQVLQSVARGDDQQARLMDIALREVDRLNALIEDFLAYARPRELILAPVDIGELLEETVALVKGAPDAKAALHFTIELCPERRIEADENALRQVIWNLIRNAVDAMEGEGTIVVSTTTVFAGTESVPYLELTVQDSGPGLDDEAMSRLFEPFFTTKAQGTGLGLATVHRIVEAHQGMIWAEDVSGGEGALFRLMLPVVQPKAGEKPTLSLVTGAPLALSGSYPPVRDEDVRIRPEAVG
jgi:two-component system sensor histidine kinase PilS (NtrC family)